MTIKLRDDDTSIYDRHLFSLEWVAYHVSLPYSELEVLTASVIRMGFD